MHRFFLGLSRLMAVLGGIVLSALIIMICLSIIGRSASSFLHGEMVQNLMPGLANWMLAHGVGPVNGDFELVEAGVAFSIFAFIPLCQITGGHASVDVFTSWMPDGAQRVLNLLIDLLFAAVLIIIAMQLYDGMNSKMRSGQTTLLLQYPIWWAYAASLIGATAAAVIGVYMAGLRITELVLRRALVTNTTGASH